MKERLINLIESFELPEIITFIITGIVSILLFIILFEKLDITPATVADFEQLEKIEVNSFQDIEELKNSNIDFSFEKKNGIIKIDFENEECKVTKKYDENFKVLTVYKIDKSNNLLSELFGIVLISGIIWHILYCICLFLIALFLFLIESLIQGLRKCLYKLL